MDTTQLLLTVVLSLTTLLLIFVGIQLIFVLRELRKTLQGLNRVIEGFESVGGGFDHGMRELAGFFTGFKTIMKTIDVIHQKRHEKSKSS